MANVQLENYTCFIQAPPTAIYDYLSDPEHYMGLQPFVIAVRDVVYGNDALGRATCRSTTVERFHFFKIIHYDNPIHALMTLTKPGELLENHVDSPGFTQVDFRTSFQPENGGTRLSESVVIHTPRLLRFYVVKQAKTAQHVRFTKLKALFESASPPAARHTRRKT